MRLRGATPFPHAMAFGAAGKEEYAKAFGRITAEESRAVGVHWNFFPDADVNSNPANPIINTRSFGEDPGQVGDLVAAYIRGARAGGMMTTAKHFPGHGDTATDSHLSVAQVTGDRARLNSVELPPFRKAIAAGVDSVMVAHVTVPALEADPNRVATTSPAIVSDLLKHELGFQGIVVTDALDMAGLTRLYAANIGRAAVDAFKAGSDLLLIPADLDASYNAVLEAARSGEIPTARLDASVLKLLKAKAALGLNKARLVDVNALPEIIGKPENLALGQQIADDAVTLVRDNGKMLPLKQSGTVKNGLPYQQVIEVHNRVVAVVLSEDVRTESGRALERAIKARVPDANVIYVDPRIATAMSDEILKAVDQAEVRDRGGLCGSNRGQGHRRREWSHEFGRAQRCQRHAVAGDSGSCRGENRCHCHGESVRGPGFPRYTELSLYFFQCRHFGNQRGQSYFWRDRHSWPPAGQHSQHCSTRRRHRAPGTNCRGGTATCAYHSRSTVIHAWPSPWFCFRRPAGPARLQRQRQERRRGAGKEGRYRDPDGRTARLQGRGRA